MTEDRQSNEIPLEDLEGRTSTKASGAGRSEDRRDFYHRDLFRRPFKGKNSNDKFLNPYDGRLCDLVVQGSKEVLQSNSGARWFRKGLKNGSSWRYRLSNWAMSRDHGSEDTVGTDVGVAIIRWIPACLALAVVVSLPIQVAGTPSNFGKYDAFLYKDWRYPLEARNKSENKHDPNFKNQQTEKQPVRGLIKRLVEPKYLCFIRADDTVEVSKVSDWPGKNGQNTPTSYVFVSFTSKHFNSTPDKRYLRDVEKHAAKAIGVNAYWISTSCLRDPKEKDEQKIKRDLAYAKQMRKLWLARSPPPPT